LEIGRELDGPLRHDLPRLHLVYRHANRLRRRLVLRSAECQIERPVLVRGDDEQPFLAGAAGPELLPNGVAPPDLDILFGLEAGANYRDVGARHDGALFKGVFGKLTTAGLHRDLRTVPAASGLDSRLCALIG